MRFGLLIDASCDVPAEVYEDPRVTVLPIHVQIGEKTLLDDRSAAVRSTFLQAAEAAHWKIALETIPLSAAETRAFILEKLVNQFDYVFAITAMRTRSVIYDTLTEVALRLPTQAMKLRTEAGIKGPFRLHVCDSATLFAGHGVIALTVLDALRSDALTTHIAQLAENTLAPNAYTYFAPASLLQLYSRAKKRGDKSLNFFTYAIGSALDVKPIVCGHAGATAPAAKVRHFADAAEKVMSNTAREIRRGVAAPHVVVSYGCTLEFLKTIPSFDSLRIACNERKVKLHLVPMGIGALVNAGPGGVAVGFVGGPHLFE